jgi:putative oxidoreductase
MLVRLYDSACRSLSGPAGLALVGTLARLVFAGVLLVYFLNSARTKLGDGLAGLWNLSAGAYVQILPKQMEAAGYDPSALGPLDHLIVYAGTYAEIVLPVLIVAGLFTRLAALGMIGFIAVMTWTDITAHGVDATTIGAWFDAQSGSLIADQRSFWVFLLVTLGITGPGPLSADALLGRFSRR